MPWALSAAIEAEIPEDRIKNFNSALILFRALQAHDLTC